MKKDIAHDIHARSAYSSDFSDRYCGAVGLFVVLFYVQAEYSESNIERSLSGRRYLDSECTRDFAIVCKTLVHFRINLMANRLFRHTREREEKKLVP